MRSTIGQRPCPCKEARGGTEGRAARGPSRLSAPGPYPARGVAGVRGARARAGGGAGDFRGGVGGVVEGHGGSALPFTAVLACGASRKPRPSRHAPRPRSSKLPPQTLHRPRLTEDTGRGAGALNLQLTRRQNLEDQKARLDTDVGYPLLSSV